METFGISNIGGYANRNIAGTKSVSDHALGKAIDVMIGNYKSQAGIAQGNSVASYFVANPGAFGTKYVIWRDQINSGRGWGPYGHPGGGRSDTLQHRDHVHVSFYANGGAVGSAPGSIANPHIRDNGGPLLPGYTYNGLGRPETVIPTPAAASPGYGSSVVNNTTINTYRTYEIAVTSGAGADAIAETVIARIRTDDFLRP